MDDNKPWGNFDGTPDSSGFGSYYRDIRLEATTPLDKRRPRVAQEPEPVAERSNFARKHQAKLKSGIAPVAVQLPPVAIDANEVLAGAAFEDCYGRLLPTKREI